MVDRELFHRLDEKWSNGCDFEIACEFFQDRGTSILIQNLRIDWQGIWKWLEEKHREIPNGAAINFEVWDNVHEGVMKGGPMLIRRILTSEGIFEELPP